MDDSAIIKPLREQFQICIKYLRSDQCANSQLGLTKSLENSGNNLLRFVQISSKKLHSRGLIRS